MQEEAVILRAVRYKDHDLILDLLSAESGRFSAMARGARKSRKRYGGALEVGSRVRLQLSAPRRGNLPTVSECDLIGALKAVRLDLDRFHHLAYVVEVCRLVTREGDPAPRIHGLLVDYLDALEQAPATAEGLALWDLGMLASTGHALNLDACVLTGGPPDAISLSLGGSVARRAMQGPGDAVPVPTPALWALRCLWRGEVEPIAAEHTGAVRRAFAHLWQTITGRDLLSARFLEVARPPAPA